MSNGMTPNRLYPAATERENLLFTALGRIPAFIDPQQRRAREQEVANYPIGQRNTLNVYRDEVRTLFASLAQGRPKVTALFKQVKPLRHNRKSVKRIRQEVQQILNAPNQSSKRRKKEKIRKSASINGLPSTLSKTTSTVPTEYESVMTHPNSRTPEVADDETTGDQTSGQPSSWHLATLPVFSLSLLSGTYTSEDFRLRLINQCASSRTLKPEPRSIQFNIANVSPLGSVPGLVRDTRLLFHVEGKAEPYSPKWANTIDFDIPFCSEELLSEHCANPDCTSQHRIDRYLDSTEMWRYSRHVGEVDRQTLNGRENISILHWPSTKRHKKFIRDDIPIYTREIDLPGPVLPDPTTPLQSCLLRAVHLESGQLYRRSLQLSMDFSLTDVHSLFHLPEPEGTPSLSAATSPREDSEVKDEVGLLSMALSILDGDRCLNQSLRERAMKFLSKMLAVYPHYRLVWQLYLALFLRDQAESHQSKLHQTQLCESFCGPWYRKSLMTAAICTNIFEKIVIYKKTIAAFVRQAESAPMQSRTVACCLDLILRIVYLEHKSTGNPFNDESTFCSQLLTSVISICGSEAEPSEDGEWLQTALKALQTDSEQCFILCYALIHARLYKEMSTSVIYAFGFPKTLEFLKWKRSEPSDDALDDVTSLLGWATHPDTVGADFFESAERSHEAVRIKKVFIGNMLLLLHSCGLPSPLERLQELFPQMDALNHMAQSSPFIWFEVAEIMDAKIEANADPELHDTSRGLILEQLIAELALIEPASLLQAWIERLFREESTVCQRVLLVVHKALLVSQKDKDDAVMADNQFLELCERVAKMRILDYSEDGMDTLTTDRFFSCLSSFYSRLVKQEPIDLPSFVQQVSNLTQNDQILTQRLWMEFIPLAVAALPRDDPRNKAVETQRIDDADAEASFSEVADYLKRRQASFAVVMTLIKSFGKDQIITIEALDNFGNDLSQLPPAIAQVLESPKKSETTPLLELLYMIVPVLHRHEVLEVVQFLLEAFPSSPALVEFLLDIASDKETALDLRFLRLLLTALLQSVPSPEARVWKRVISIGGFSGHNLGKLVESILRSDVTVSNDHS